MLRACITLSYKLYLHNGAVCYTLPYCEPIGIRHTRKEIHVTYQRLSSTRSVLVREPYFILHLSR